MLTMPTLSDHQERPCPYCHFSHRANLGPIALCPAAFDRVIDLRLGDISVDGCITKAHAAARKQDRLQWTAAKAAQPQVHSSARL